MVVENTIATGVKEVGKETATTVFYDAVNNITVIINSVSGCVVATSYGQIKQ